MFFSRNQSISFIIPNGNYPFVMSITKRKYILARNKVLPFDSQQNKVLKCFFPTPKHQYCLTQRELPICVCPSRKETRFLPRVKFVPLFPNKQRVELIFFLRSKHQYRLSQYKLSIFLSPSRKETRFFP